MNVCDNCKREYVKAKLLDGKWICDKCTFISPHYSKDVHAFFQDSKGNYIPVDSKGNVLHTHKYSNDPRGWKRAGKSTEGYNKTIHLSD